MPFGKREGGGRRIAQRLPAKVPALILGLDSSEAAIVVDVSFTGAKLRGVNLPRADHDIWLKVGAVDVLATVVWSTGEHCGVTFDKPLNALQLHHLHDEGHRARYRRVTPEEMLAAEDWCNGLAR